MTRFAALTRAPAKQPSAAHQTGLSARWIPLQRQLAVGAIDDPLEREAEGIAKQVMRRPLPQASSLGAAAPALRRKCGCEGSGKPCAACEAERKDTLQRQAAAVAPIEAPPIVHEVLETPGRPLDSSTREFFEPRFHHDFGRIRVHDDAQAAASATEVSARAFTVGRHIVFGPNQYNPNSTSGRELLAHELTHTLQQSGPAGGDLLSRACLPAADCAAPAQGALGTFVKETEADPENKKKRDQRKTYCNASPVDPRCTSDGHGRPAAELQKFLNSELPARATAIKGVFVDKDIPPQYGAYTNPCNNFVPPVGGGEQCTFVPESLETEAGQYNSGAATVGGLDRRGWSQGALRTLTHETQHARFATSPGETQLAGNPCDFNSIRSSLTELTAIISEFRPVFLKNLGIAGSARDAELRWWFNFWIKDGGENISGNVKDIRCKCDCGPADEYINNMFKFASKDWNTYQKWIYNKTLKAPEWGLNWPVDPPDSVPVNEFPSPGITMDIQDIPTTTK